MSLNCNEIDVILSELDLTGAFIQDIIQPGYDTLALYTYKNGTPTTVLICIKPDSCRINATPKKITRNDKPLRFMEFLRSRIRGAKILACQQIDKQRIIRLDLGHDDQLFIMYIRLWSNAGNIVLCDEQNNILDTMYRRPGKNEVTSGVFTLPEPQTAIKKEWPVRSFDDIVASFTQKHPDAPPLTFNQKVDIWYSEFGTSLSREALLRQAEKWYNTHYSKQEHALKKLQNKKKLFENASSLKHQGDLILSFGYSIAPGSQYLDCTDYDTGNSVHIKLDATKSVQENAAIYYDQYKKAESGLVELEHEIALAQKKLTSLTKEYETIQKQTNPVIIEQMLRRDSTPKQQQKKQHPGLDYTIDGWYILVGRDANENDDLLRHHVRGQDLWLHTRDCPGGYVFVKNRPGKTVPLDILLYAGNLAVYYSKARKAGKADLYYTQVKHLRRAKNGPKGLVLPTHEKNLTIQLDEKRLHRLDEIQAEAQFV
ncbi:MAG: NFACT family protein [Treponema sp.]|nr:NFACT family protein [Treponema sp.]